jgi:hypothetical protein
MLITKGVDESTGDWQAAIDCEKCGVLVALALPIDDSGVYDAQKVLPEGWIVSPSQPVTRPQAASAFRCPIHAGDT